MFGVSPARVKADMRSSSRQLYLAGALWLAGVAFVQADPEEGSTVHASSDATATTFTFEGFSRAFGESFMVILATEIGDRTFFIAAIMAMRHSRLVVWSGAVGALVVMTILSTLVGHVAPLLISRTYTQYAAAGLFLFFGVKMVRDGLHVDHAGASEELEEVEAELIKKQEDVPADEEAATPSTTDDTMNKIMMQAFTLTFLAEWGDRSQIATIALVCMALARTCMACL